MQRKTNLFYLQGADSNFITFSNYTESLTGNFLATDWKLFPSAFICLNLPNLTKDNKPDFIKYIAAYYENKLAFMRDNAIKENKSVEENIYPLEYLFEALFNSDKEYLQGIEIRYISDITEQNYNGVYADTICTIDGTEMPNKYDLILSNNNSFGQVEYNFDKSYLYGWYLQNENNVNEYTGPEEYKDIQPVFDENIDNISFYNKYTKYDGIKITKYDPADTTSLNSISFNIIIPLFSLVNINSKTNITIINENNEFLFGNNGNNENHINVPMGIWFADNKVVLKRDINNNYAPAWSLVLSSQFKPLPYSKSLLNDTVADVYNEGAYQTFAQVLARQNMLLDKFNELNIEVAKLNNKIENIESRLNSIGTQSNIDDLHVEMVNFKREISNLLSMYNIDNNSTVKWEAKF